MINKKEYQGKCWWCGSESDSKEHKYKKSDIIREFGQGPYQNEIVRVLNQNNSHIEINIQGPKSKQIKYSYVLCANCNNNRSSAFDRSYDVFMDYLKINEDKIYITKSIDLFDIFGEEWKKDSENIIRYMVKHISCRLAENEVEITQEIIDFMNGYCDLKYLKLILTISSEKADFVQMLKKNNEDDGYISITPLTGMYYEKSHNWDYLFGSYDYRGFRFAYYYSKSIEGFDCNLDNRIIAL